MLGQPGFVIGQILGAARRQERQRLFRKSRRRRPALVLLPETDVDGVIFLVPSAANAAVLALKLFEGDDGGRQIGGGIGAGCCDGGDDRGGRDGGADGGGALPQRGHQRHTLRDLPRKSYR